MPYIRGQEVKEGPREFPANEKMWNMYVAQARARFAKWPSPTASSWVRAQYLQAGGKLVPKKSQVDPRFIDWQARAEDAKREKEEKPVKKTVKKVVKRKNLGNGQFTPR